MCTVVIRLAFGWLLRQPSINGLHHYALQFCCCVIPSAWHALMCMWGRFSFVQLGWCLPHVSGYLAAALVPPARPPSPPRPLAGVAAPVTQRQWRVDPVGAPSLGACIPPAGQPRSTSTAAPGGVWERASGSGQVRVSKRACGRAG